jgi:hypothetical protein
MVIAGDTLIEGRRYHLETVYSATPGSPEWVIDFVAPLRFDSTSSRVMEWSETLEVPRTCQLSAAFWSMLDCYEWTGPNGEPEETAVQGGYGGSVHFWRSGQDVPVPAIKTYSSIVDGGALAHAATIGLVGLEGFCCSNGYFRIRYARIAGVEHGEQIPVAVQASPDGPVPALSASPNPTRGPIALTIDIPRNADVTVEGFDATGRRVYRIDRMLPPGRHALPVDLSHFPAGVYFFRATAGDGPVSTTVVRR